jgi:hypothetical protein
MARFASGRRIAGPAGATSRVVGSCSPRPASPTELERQSAVREAARSRYLDLLARQELVGWEQLSHELVR